MTVLLLYIWFTNVDIWFLWKGRHPYEYENKYKCQWIHVLVIPLKLLCSGPSNPASNNEHKWTSRISQIKWTMLPGKLAFIVQSGDLFSLWLNLFVRYKIVIKEKYLFCPSLNCYDASVWWKEKVTRSIKMGASECEDRRHKPTVQFQSWPWGCTWRTLFPRPGECHS